MKIHKSSSQHIGLVFIALTLAACGGVPQVKRLDAPAEPAGTPYTNILVISLFDSFDTRRYFEEETVKALKAGGTQAVTLTSLLKIGTPVNRETVIPVVEKIGADAVLVTQVTDMQTTGKIKDRRPESSTNIRPTYYYNVFSVDVTEYVEPPAVQYHFNLALRADLIAVDNKESVWAVASTTKDKSDFEGTRDYSKIVNQAKAIVDALASDHLIAR